MTEAPLKPRSNLQLRVISGLVLGIVVLLITWWGGFPFRLLMVAMAAAIFHEWLFMRDGQNKVHILISRFVLAGSLSLVLVGVPPVIVFGGIVIAAIIAAISGLVTSSGLWATWGVLYAGLPAAAMALLRGSSLEGLWAILFLLGVVWGTDTIAYFTGRALGGPKLAPAISPGKTWSGAIGGAIGGVIVATVIATFAWGDSGILAICLVAFLLSVASQIGDLFESAIKRRHGVKDSGTLIPGHGGIMDRVDGLVAAAIVLFLLWMPLVWSSVQVNGFTPG